jgi:hypothetical protein
MTSLVCLARRMVPTVPSWKWRTGGAQRLAQYDLSWRCPCGSCAVQRVHLCSSFTPLSSVGSSYIGHGFAAMIALPGARFYCQVLARVCLGKFTCSPRMHNLELPESLPERCMPKEVNWELWTAAVQAHAAAAPVHLHCLRGQGRPGGPAGLWKGENQYDVSSQDVFCRKCCRICEHCHYAV